MQIDSINIAQTASAATIIYEALKKAIIEGQLEDGAPLRQDEIAKMFNTSRIPVREAITMLEQQGLVVTQRYKGAVVAGISPDEAAEIWDFRALVEGHVIEAAVPRMSEETLELARSYLTAFSEGRRRSTGATRTASSTRSSIATAGFITTSASSRRPWTGWTVTCGHSWHCRTGWPAPMPNMRGFWPPACGAMRSRRPP